MPRLKLFYTIRNGGDGSASASFHADEECAQLACDLEDEGGEAYCENWPNSRDFEFDAQGRLLNPDDSQEELERELAEARGEDVEDEEENDETTPSATFNKAATPDKMDPDAVYKGEIWYVLRNCGDGSAAVSFYGDEASAQLRADIEDESEPFCDNGPYCQKLEFNGRGLLLNPDSSREELQRELAEARGEDVEDEDAPEEDATPAAVNTATEPLDLNGKTVVFTGKLSTMTRKQAESAATALGAHVTDSVTANTDILVVGEDAGSKLAKAKALGVDIVTEAEWNARTKPSAPAPKPPGGFRP